MADKPSGVLTYNMQLKEETRILLDTLPDNAAILGREGRIKAVNFPWQQFGRENNFSGSDFGLGKNYVKIAEQADGQNAEKADKAAEGIKAVLEGRMNEFSLPYPCHGPQKKRWFKLRVKRYKNGALVLHENITEQKLESLWNESLFKNSTSAITILDKDSRIIDINKKFTDKFGYNLEDIEGKKLDDVLEKGKTGSVNRNMTQEVLDGNKMVIEGVRYDKSGKPREFLIKGVPVKVEADVKGVYGIFEDITELKQKERKLRRSSERLRTTLESIGDGVIATNTKGEITRMNSVAEKLTGWPLEDARGQRLTEVFNIVNSHTGEPVDNPVDEVLATGKKVGLANHTMLIARDGSEYQIADSAAPIRDKDDNLTGVVLIFRDVTEEYRMREKLRKSEEKYHAMIDNCFEMIYLHDLEGNIIEINQAVKDKMGYCRDDIKNMTIFDLHPGDTGRYDKNDIMKQWKSWDVGERVLVEVEHRQKDGSTIPVEVSTGKVKFGGEEYLIAFVRDITERREKEKEVEYLSRHDSLTDLYNRFHMEKRLEKLEEEELPASIIMVDINGLKIINDTYGHDKGDELLVKTSQFLQEAAGEKDIICRWAGDEFVILLPETNLRQARQLRAEIEKRFERIESEIPVTLAIGVACKTNPDKDIFTVLHEAEDSMQEHKLTSEKSSRSKLVSNLLNTLGAKSDETKEHAVRMSEYALQLGERIGLNQEKLNKLTLLATLHDIGKVTISEEILTKPGDLDEDEWEIIKDHTRRGYTIATSTEEFSPVAEGILHHHERWDGEGYPQGLAGEEIPLLARIISIVDAYDVMTNGRPYKTALSREEALEEIEACAGSQFDPRLAKEFVQMMREKHRSEDN